MKFLMNFARRPVLYAGIARLRRRGLLTPRRALHAAGAAGSSALGTFVLVGLAGLSVIDRYLLVPSLMVMVFAAVALGGLDDAARRALRARSGPSPPRRSSSTASPSPPRGSTSRQLQQRAELPRRLARARCGRCSTNPKVRAGLRCGPVSTPNHKLVPDARWLLDASASEVIAAQRRHRARADRAAAWRSTRSTAGALLRQALVGRDRRHRSTTSRCRASRAWRSRDYYSAYVRC